MDLLEHSGDGFAELSLCCPGDTRPGARVGDPDETVCWGVGKIERGRIEVEAFGVETDSGDREGEVGRGERAQVGLGVNVSQPAGRASKRRVVSGRLNRTRLCKGGVRT